MALPLRHGICLLIETHPNISHWVKCHITKNSLTWTQVTYLCFAFTVLTVKLLEFNRNNIYFYKNIYEHTQSVTLSSSTFNFNDLCAVFQAFLCGFELMEWWSQRVHGECLAFWLNVCWQLGNSGPASSSPRGDVHSVTGQTGWMLAQCHFDIFSPSKRCCHRGRCVMKRRQIFRSASPERSLTVMHECNTGRGFLFLELIRILFFFFFF